MERIALVEDDRDLALLIEHNLRREGYLVNSFERATPFFDFITKNKVDLILLDIMLPDLDGFRVLRFLKNRVDLKDIPLILITARGGEEDKIKGLELGADDYVTKPFSVRELLARVRAVLRRYKKNNAEGVLELDGIKVLINEGRVLVDGKEVNLTPTEMRILALLMENYGRAMSRGFIVEALGLHETGERAVDVHIKHIRDKLGPYKHYVKTVRGIGYKVER